MTRHRIMTQIKEEEKKTEKQLNDLKIINFHKKSPQTNDSQDGSRTWK